MTIWFHLLTWALAASAVRSTFINAEEFPFSGIIENNGTVVCSGIILDGCQVASASACFDVGIPTEFSLVLATYHSLKRFRGSPIKEGVAKSSETHNPLSISVMRLESTGVESSTELNNDCHLQPAPLTKKLEWPGLSSAKVIGIDSGEYPVKILSEDACLVKIALLHDDNLLDFKLRTGPRLLCGVELNRTSLGNRARCRWGLLGAPLVHEGSVIGILTKTICNKDDSKLELFMTIAQETIDEPHLTIRNVFPLKKRSSTTHKRDSMSDNFLRSWMNKLHFNARRKRQSTKNETQSNIPSAPANPPGSAPASAPANAPTGNETETDPNKSLSMDVSMSSNEASASSLGSGTAGISGELASANLGSGSSTGSEGNAGSGGNAGSDSNAGGDSNAGSDSNAGGDSNAGSDSNTGSGSGTGAGSSEGQGSIGGESISAIDQNSESKGGYGSSISAESHSQVSSESIPFGNYSEELDSVERGGNESSETPGTYQHGGYEPKPDYQPDRPLPPQGNNYVPQGGAPRDAPSNNGGSNGGGGGGGGGGPSASADGDDTATGQRSTNAAESSYVLSKTLLNLHIFFGVLPFLFLSSL